jgi:hypothetical protein
MHGPSCARAIYAPCSGARRGCRPTNWAARPGRRRQPPLIAPKEKEKEKEARPCRWCPSTVSAVCCLFAINSGETGSDPCMAFVRGPPPAATAATWATPATAHSTSRHPPEIPNIGLSASDTGRQVPTFKARPAAVGQCSLRTRTLDCPSSGASEQVQAYAGRACLWTRWAWRWATPRRI